MTHAVIAKFYREHGYHVSARLRDVMRAVEDDVREQVARDIEASGYAMTDPYDASAPMLITVEDAARIARGRLT